MTKPTTSDTPKPAAWAIGLLLASSLFALTALVLLGAG